MKRSTTIILIGVLVGCSLAFGAESGRSTTTKKTKVGYHCLFIGHSFFIPVAKRFEMLSGQYGVANHRQDLVSAGGRGGSPGGLWKKAVKRVAIQKILESGKIELLGMPYQNSLNRPIQGYTFEDYRRWIDYALEYNSKTAFFLALPWGRDGAKRELAEYAWANQKANEALYRTVIELRKHYPKNTFFYVNYGLASIELKGLFEAGQLSDVKTLTGKFGLYRDSTGHATNILKDLSALIWLTTLYDVDLANSNLKLNYKTDLKPIAAKIIAEQTGSSSKRTEHNQHLRTYSRASP